MRKKYTEEDMRKERREAHDRGYDAGITRGYKYGLLMGEIQKSNVMHIREFEALPQFFTKEMALKRSPIPQNLLDLEERW